MEDLLRSLIFSPIGFLWLFLRYRNKAERSKIFNEEYDGSYDRAGIIIFLRLIFSICLLGISAIILSVIYWAIRSLFR